MTERMCQECGLGLKVPGKKMPAAKKFCGPKCRMSFNNRRRDRGSEVYDLLMVMRFERDQAKDERLWSVICSQAAAYRDADKFARNGRKSWQSMEDALAAIPLYRSQAGDKR